MNKIEFVNLEKEQNDVSIMGKPSRFRLNKDKIVSFYSDEIVNSFTKDNVYLKDFWERYYNENTSDIEYVKQKEINSLFSSNHLNCIRTLLASIYESEKDLKILEIGGGIGALYDYLNKSEIINVEENYFNIDFGKFFDHKNFYETKGTGIPEKLLNENHKFDIVYSYDVFNVINKIDRLSYYYGIYDVLNKGGKFLLTLHMCTEENENDSFWGIKDFNNNNYSFYKEFLIEVSNLEEFSEDIKNIGFRSVCLLGYFDNYMSFLIEK